MVVVFAVAEYESGAQYRHAPQQASGPVYPVERLSASLEIGPIDEQHEQHCRGEHPRDEKVHVLPPCEKGDVYCRQSGKIYAALHQQIYVTEPYRHVSLRRNPQLNRRIAHERGPQSENAGEKACPDHQRNVVRVHANQVGGY